MGRLQRTIGILLVVGLFAGSAIGFAVAQAGKSKPPAIVATDFTRATWFSPTCACPTSTARFTITAAGSDTVSVRIVDAATLRPVRQLATDVPTLVPIMLVWDGRTDAGTLAPDGAYKAQVLFPKQPTRTVLDVMHLDTHAPVVRATMPADTVLPAGGGGSYPFQLVSDEAATMIATVYQVAPDQSVAEVWRQAVPAQAKAGSPQDLVWDGSRRNPAGAAAPGSYIVGYEVTDAAGNLTRAPTAFQPGRLGQATPVQVQRVDVTGHGSVLTPYTGPLSFSISRLHPGGRTTFVRSGTTAVRVIPPATQPGLFVTTATVGGHTGSGFDSQAAGARTLVVVPTMTWQAANRYDGNGDGFPDVLPGPLGLTRPLPDAAGAARRLMRTAAPALGHRAAYGAITDIALQPGVPAGTRLVIVAGLRVWTPALRLALRGFTRHGGRVLFASSPFDRLGAVTPNGLVVDAAPHRARLHGIGRTVS